MLHFPYGRLFHQDMPNFALLFQPARQMKARMAGYVFCFLFIYLFIYYYGARTEESKYLPSRSSDV